MVGYSWLISADVSHREQTKDSGSWLTEPLFELKLNGVRGTGMRSHKLYWGRVSKTFATLLSHTEGLSGHAYGNF